MRQRLAGDGEICFARTELTDRIWLVWLAPSDGPVSYYRYRCDTAELALPFHDWAELNDYQLARKQPFAFAARDGLRVHGDFSYPPGVPARGLPAVVNVHGGPWHRDIWAGSHDEPWWLADRGYACVQVNFRGSTGYGKAFINAGDKQWARAMHTDLLDAIDHLAAQGTIDPAPGAPDGMTISRVIAALTGHTWHEVLLDEDAPPRTPCRWRSARR